MSDSTLPPEAISLPDFDWDFVTVAVAWLAARTETKLDDAAVDFLKVAKDDPFIKRWLAGQVAYADSVPPGTLSLVAEPPEEVVEALRQGGVFKTARDAGEIVTTLKELLPYVVSLLQFFRTITGK
jgi:hypothetical protein